MYLCYTFTALNDSIYMKLISFLIPFSLVLFMLTSCGPKELGVKDANGKYVSHLSGDKIVFEDDSFVTLPKDVERTYYLIRHAEKDSLPKGNPYLTEQGKARSTNLAKLFKQSRIDEVYSTMTNRTFYTVDSLARMKGISTKIYTPKNFKETVAVIDSIGEATKILVVGHSNTLPVIANYLSDSKHYNQQIAEDQYDDFVVVHQLSDGSRKLLTLKYRNTYE